MTSSSSPPIPKARFCLAGGCFKSLIHGRPPNDLDLWPKSEEDRLTLIRHLTTCGAQVEGETQFNTVLAKQCDTDFWNFIQGVQEVVEHVLLARDYYDTL